MNITEVLIIGRPASTHHHLTAAGRDGPGVEGAWGGSYAVVADSFHPCSLPGVKSVKVIQSTVSISSTKYHLKCEKVKREQMVRMRTEQNASQHS